MLKNRLIPVLYLKNGLLVRSEKFKFHQVIGNPVAQVERYNSWNVDELIYIDITKDEEYTLKRDDLKMKDSKTIFEIIAKVSEKCFMPLTVGGKIRTIEDIKKRLQGGADKVTINTVAIENPNFITEAAKIFGSQCIVVSIDFKKTNEGYEVYYNHGEKSTGKNPVEWAKQVEKLGAGEIFLNSIDRDGTAEGYDLELIKKVNDAVNIPVIACGGVGEFDDFKKGLNTGASAVAAGNIFNFTEHSYKFAKKELKDEGFNVR